MPSSEKRTLVESTIVEMGLRDCADTFIGNWHLRAISGGEKRRVSIALEILMRPRLLFLDEPTSGVGSASAFFVTQTTRCLSRDGRTVIASIHQPSSEVFEQLDRLYLLSGGKTVYFGQTSEAYRFFAEAGFPCSSFRNPSDHFLRCINSDFDRVKATLRGSIQIASIFHKTLDNNNPHQSPTEAAAAQTATYPPQTPYHHLLQQQLQMFWTYQRQEIEQVNDLKNHQLPLARLKKIMKADEDVRMISAEAPILFAKACELFILELTIRSWLHAEENKRGTLQKNDIAAAITRTDIFDFLVDIVPRDEIKDEGVVVLGPGIVCSTASGVPYYYPPLGQPDPGGVRMGRPAVMPGVDPSMYVHPPPSQAWQSVWQTADDNSYASGGSSGQGNLDGEGYLQ